GRCSKQFCQVLPFGDKNSEIIRCSRVERSETGRVKKRTAQGWWAAVSTEGSVAFDWLLGKSREASLLVESDELLL
ncbi:MAG: hypothetical protein QG664_235, partial [Patescibacteria group bacterium]|nr:hypothetical protein [Patescibacteria group bacterium]